MWNLDVSLTYEARKRLLQLFNVVSQRSSFEQIRQISRDRFAYNITATMLLVKLSVVIQTLATRVEQEQTTVQSWYFLSYKPWCRHGFPFSLWYGLGTYLYINAHNNVTIAGKFKTPLSRLDLPEFPILRAWEKIVVDNAAFIRQKLEQDIHHALKNQEKPKARRIAGMKNLSVSVQMDWKWVPIHVESINHV